MIARESRNAFCVLLAGLAVASGLFYNASAAASPQETVDPPFQDLPNTASFATSDSNDRMIAVTGIDVTGSSVLYLIDTVSRNLAVYQAQGGTSSTQNIKLVGARNIDLDLQLDGYNDESDYTYKQLVKEFNPTGGKTPQDPTRR